MIPGLASRGHERWAGYRSSDLVWLALLALALRVAYLFAGLSTQDLAAIALVPDSEAYLQLADYFRTGHTEGGRHLLVAGPGYAGVLASLSVLFGPGLWPPVVLNILLAAAAPLAVYLLALLLFQDRVVALISGLIVSLSFTGISLSTSVLTDQPYYTLHIFALLAFVLGLKTGRSRWFVVAGLVAGIATLIRAIGQPWPYLFLVIAVVHVFCCPPPRPRRYLLRSLWTPSIMLVMILSWSAANQARQGLFTFTTNGVRSTWAYLAAMAVADHTPGGSIDSVRAAWTAELRNPGNVTEPTEAELHGRMKSKIFEVVSQHPDWWMQSYLLTVWRNVRVPNYFPEHQVPQWRSCWVPFREVCHGQINPLILMLTLSALGWLAVRREWESLLILGSTYVLFTLTIGFSFWQGSRLHYPAEMAWSILVSYLAVQVWRRLRKLTPARARSDGMSASRRPA